MKPVFIRINDVADIDTSKVSVYDLNNRYIDSNGNMFGLKYNPGSRKIEIIKIVRAVDREVTDMQQKIYKKKATEVDSFETEIEEPGHSEDEIAASGDENFDPEMFINDCIKLMSTHRERLKGIIMNIKNSNVYPKENKADSLELESIFRNIEIDCEMAFDQVDSYQKELMSYPRSITYYQAKIDNKGNEVIEGLAGDKDRIMRFVYMYEMYSSIDILYKNVFKVIKTLYDFIDEKNVDEMKTLGHPEKQAFEDGKTSTLNTVNEVEDLLNNVRRLENYIYEPDNF